MSIRVDLADLPNHIVRRGGGYLLTSIMDSRPHATHLRFDVAAADGQVQLRAQVGRTSLANCRHRPAVTVLFPAVVPGSIEGEPAVVDGTNVDEYSLIIDGEARLDGDSHVIIAVTGSVFHRPVPDPGGGT